jgi:hypothetical protein
MYAIPIAVLLAVAVVAVAWTPLFALVVAVPLFVAFLAYIGLRPPAEERLEAPGPARRRAETETPRGAWGERRA